MISIEREIIDWLLADDGVKQIVGERVCSFPAPGSWVIPFVVFVRTGTERTRHQRGLSGNTLATMEFQCWAATRESAWELAREVQERLETYGADGPTPGQTIGETRVKRIMADNDHDIVSEQDPGDDDGPRGVSVTAMIQYVESAGA